MLDHVLESVVNGVYVLSAHHQGKINGTTVAWVSPVSYEPLLVMVALAQSRFSHDLVKQSGYFGLNVLASDQQEVARHFGFKTAKSEDKLEGMTFSASEHGLPILGGVKSYIECRVVDSCRAGEHTLFVGEVINTQMFKEDAKSLVFRQEDYF